MHGGAEVLLAKLRPPVLHVLPCARAVVRQGDVQLRLGHALRLALEVCKTLVLRHVPKHLCHKRKSEEVERYNEDVSTNIRAHNRV